MRYLELRAEGFRNLAPLALTFHPEVNWIYGANGHGKTNLLESLQYLVSGRSHRGARDEDLVHFKGQHFYLEGSLQDDGGESLRFRASYERGGSKRLRLDEDEVQRLSELVGLTGTVLFGPGDVDLISGQPEGRRRWLDYTLSKTDAGYLRDLIAYRRILKQRNALLKEGGAASHLEAWTERLVNVGSRLVLRRRENIVPLSEYAAKLHAEMSPAEEDLKLIYNSKLQGDSPEAVADSLRASLERLHLAETLKKRTLSGPHRDDMAIDIGGRDARKFASQGQKRSAAVALKLAQAEYLAKVRRDRPIVFLDDVFSELDEDRREKLCHLVGRQYQTFLATPQPRDLRLDLFEEIKRFRVDAGNVYAE